MVQYLRRWPALLREQLLAQSEELLAHPIILDEVQRVPLLLGEVHWLIENKGLRFIRILPWNVFLRTLWAGEIIS